MGTETKKKKRGGRGRRKVLQLGDRVLTCKCGSTWASDFAIPVSMFKKGKVIVTCTQCESEIEVSAVRRRYPRKSRGGASAPIEGGAIVFFPKMVQQPLPGVK